MDASVGPWSIRVTRLASGRADGRTMDAHAVAAAVVKVNSAPGTYGVRRRAAHARILHVEPLGRYVDPLPVAETVRRP